MSRTVPRAAALCASIAATALALTACSGTHSDATGFVPSQAALPVLGATSAPAQTQKTATLNQLNELQPTVSAPTTAFDPAQFGTDLPTVAHSKCNAYDFVLARDLVDVVYTTKRSCAIASGALFDKSTATWAWYISGAANDAVGVDNIVSLSDAWASGAFRWPAARRETFRTEPANLIAASTATIADKAGKNAAGWLPSADGDRCNYVAQQIAVKLDFALTITSAERAAMAGVLNACPDTFVAPQPTSSPPTAGSPPPPPPSPTKTHKPTPTPTKKASVVKPAPKKTVKPTPTPTPTKKPSPSPTVTITTTVTATPSSS
jgi:hypothetical protein